MFIKANNLSIDKNKLNDLVSPYNQEIELSMTGN